LGNFGPKFKSIVRLKFYSNKVVSLTIISATFATRRPHPPHSPPLPLPSRHCHRICLPSTATAAAAAAVAANSAAISASASLNPSLVLKFAVAASACLFE
jgi:hypothetical protein